MQMTFEQKAETSVLDIFVNGEHWHMLRYLLRNVSKLNS